MATSFAYFYWSGRYDANRDQLPVELMVRGAATGIGPGSAVLFNGLRAGQVTGLVSDPVDPQLVIVQARIDKNLPIKTDTKASIGSQGITGVAIVNLDGGTIEAPRLVDPNAETVAVLQTRATADIVTQAQGLTTRADDILSEVQSFIVDNRSNLDATVKNVREFSDALNANSDELEDLLKSAGDVAKSLNGLATTLAPAAGQLEQILASVEPEKIKNITTNVEKFTQDIAGASTRVDKILSQAEEASKGLATFSES